MKTPFLLGLAMSLISCDCPNNNSIELDSITIASWNLKNFGETKFSDESRMDVILDIILRFDIIALQEIQDADLSMPQDLIDEINSRGEGNYRVIASDRVGRGQRKEQYLFIYNDDIIDIIDQTSGYGIEPQDEFAREPFYCMFSAGEFDFYLMTIHTDPDDVSVEIPALVTAYQQLQNDTPLEDDIILLGDLNAKPPDVDLGSYIDMSSFLIIPDIYFSIEDETNTRGGRCYDNIIFQSNFTSEYLHSGVCSFEYDYNLTNDQAFAISDHLPVWASFRITSDDD